MVLEIIMQYGLQVYMVVSIHRGQKGASSVGKPPMGEPNPKEMLEFSPMTRAPPMGL